MADQPSQSLQIRDARPEDYEAIQQLTLSAYEQYATLMEPDAWQALRRAMISALTTDSPVERIIAELDGQLVGSSMLFPAARSAYQGITNEAAVPELRLLAVDTSVRGHGIGRALVEECIRRARQTGIDALGLHTSNSMQTAKSLYERMGFERYPAEDFQPNGTELVMAYRFKL